MKKTIIGIFIFLFLLSASALPLYAAMVKSGDSIYLPENERGLKDLHAFGNTVTVEAPVINDLITAGNTVTINGDINGNLMAAGNDVIIRSHVTQSARLAGSNVIISGPVDRDLLIAAGKIRITSEASISGDLLFFSGEAQIEGPVNGNIHGNGGSITINAPVKGNVTGNFGQLTLGPNAKINGSLRYTADERAAMQPGATIKGQQEYRQEEKTEAPTGIGAAFTTGSLYKLTIDIIVSLLFITFIPLLVKTTLERAVNKPLASAGTGFLILIFMPLLSLFLLFLLYVGLAAFLLYGLLIIINIFMSKLLIGWWIMRWWANRDKKEYTLDWKAAVTGSVVSFILMLIPILGWIVGAIIYLMTFGAVTKSVIALATGATTHEDIKKIKA